jgi:hypothetical protein
MSEERVAIQMIVAIMFWLAAVIASFCSSARGSGSS